MKPLLVWIVENMDIDPETGDVDWHVYPHAYVTRKEAKEAARVLSSRHPYFRYRVSRYERTA